MSEKQPIPKPRVIIEQQPDGSLIMESYINGSRKRIELQLGFEAFEIKDELRTQAKAIASYAERERERIAEAANKRHNQAWRYVATNHGVEFANRTVNGVKSNKLNAKVNAKEKPEQQSIKEMLALL